jgi:hypothetical protein
LLISIKKSLLLNFSIYLHLFSTNNLKLFIMPLACGLVQSDLNPCTAKPSMGLDSIALIANKAEIATSPYSTTTMLVTDLTMESGKYFYEVVARPNKPFDEFKISAEEKKFGKTFKREVTLILKGLSPSSVQQVNILSKGEFVLIFKQKGVSDSSKYPALGIETSLTGATFEWNQAEGAWTCVLSEDMLDVPALFLWKTDLATTDALFEGLTA